MSYGKKDEDVEGSVLKVDRVAVFQEGKDVLSQLKLCVLTCLPSSTFQLFPHLTSEMSSSPHQDRATSLHGGCFSS